MKRSFSFFSFMLVLVLFLSVFVSSVGATWVGGAPSTYAGGSCGDDHLIEWRYDLAITGTITELHLTTGQTWSSGGAWDLDQVYLKVNGTLVSGHPTFDDTYNNDSYWNALVWTNIDKVISNGKPLFEVLYNFTNSNAGCYGLDSNDMDGDGDHTYRYTPDILGDAYTDFNGIYDAHYSQGFDVVYAMKYVSSSSSSESVTTNSATNITYNSSTLNGYLNLAGAVSHSCYFQYSKVSNYAVSDLSGSVLRNSDGSYLVKVSGLDIGTLYYYRAIAMNTTSSGILYGLNSTFTTSSSGINDLYFNFYDKKTGTKLAYYTNEYTGTTYPDNYLKGRLFVKDNELTYDGVRFLSSEAVSGSASFTQNTSTFINVSGWVSDQIVGKVSGANVVWYFDENSFVLFGGNTYDIYLVRVGDADWNDIPNSYIATYGSFFVEFYSNGSCYYHVGYSPILVYNLNNSKFNDTAGYIWRIYTSAGSNVASGYIYFSGASSSGYIFPTYKFVSAGSYYLKVFNISNGSALSVVYAGEYLVDVCENDYGDNTSAASPVNYSPLIGFALALSIGFVAMYVGGGGLGFVGGFFGSMMMLSIPGTIMYMGFPIWVMFLAGLTLVVLVFTIARR
ncbi:MAG: hypothetical protein H7836_13195 [Magnetococcus sp. YQC-3]